MKLLPIIGLMFSLLTISWIAPNEKTIDLSGEWRFSIDREDKGIAAQWFNKLLSDKVVLPGSMSTNGKGDDITLKTRWTGQIVDSSFYKSPAYARYRNPGNIKIPFWGKHLITICIDNRTKEIDPGLNSYSISDHTLTNWNGMVGEMYLQSRPAINIHDIRIYPDIDLKKITAKINVNNHTGKPAKIKLNLKVKSAGNLPVHTAEFTISGGDSLVTLDYQMGDTPSLWSEFYPALYHLTTVLTDLTSLKRDTCRCIFGMREFKAVGKQIQVNHQPIFLRGTLECAIFPKTGYPATDTKAWLRIFRICHAHGLNHMHFHSWCPPEAQQLLYSLDKYKSGNQFNPKVELDADMINNLIKL
jgi:beta-galactosidase/beta-glucuronidase